MRKGEASFKHGDFETGVFNVGALIIRTGFWGLLYYIYNKEPPK